MCVCVGVCVHMCKTKCSCFVGLNVKEVAHDYATSVSGYVTNGLQLINSYDTWHGMYYVGCSMFILHYRCPSLPTKNVIRWLLGVVRVRIVQQDSSKVVYMAILDITQYC